MPMVVLVASVHHTGTQFAYDHMLSDDRGWTFIVPNPYTTDVEKELQAAGKTKGKLRIHVDPPFRDRLHVWLKEYPAIVPLRHPRAVANSWKNKGKDLAWLDTQWKMLKEEIDPYEPYYAPLNDSPLKEDFLWKLEKGIGIRFVHEWPIVMPGVEDIGKFDLDEQDEEWIKSWMEDGFFERFGYEY